MPVLALVTILIAIAAIVTTASSLARQRILKCLFCVIVTLPVLPLSFLAAVTADGFIHKGGLCNSATFSNFQDMEPFLQQSEFDTSPVLIVGPDLPAVKMEINCGDELVYGHTLGQATCRNKERRE